MSETVEAYTKLIESHAHVALKKVKKPSEYELDDFIQEGVKMFILVKRDIYDPEKGCSFKTFFTRILRQHFGSIVTKSYKHNKLPDNNTVNTISNKNPIKFAHNAFDIVSMRHILQDFTVDELGYAKTILSFVDKPVKFRRKLTREALNISYERERELRSSIHDKILK